jgi:ABC-type branched-subunit amino acid transport system ATPase component/MFS family permease
VTSVLDGPSLLDADPDTRAGRRAAARELLGVSGTPQDVPPLRPVLREHRLTTYPMFALGLLGIVDTFQTYAFGVLTPEISRALGLSFTSIAAARTVASLGVVLSPLPMAALSQSRGRRAMLCLVTGIAWSIITLTTGFVTSLLALMAVLVLDGLSTGSVLALHSPLLVDTYPPQARVRILSGYRGMVVLGQVLSPLFVALLAGPLHLTWRGVFLAMGLTSLAATLFAIRLRDPGPGRFDADALRAEEHEAVTGESASVDPDDVKLGFFEILRRLLLIPTVRQLASGYFAIGMLLIPLQTYLSVFLEQRWGLGPGARGLFFAGVATVGILALGLYAKRAEAAFAQDPARVLTIAAVSLVWAVCLFALGAVAPVFALTCVLFALGQAGIAVLIPSLDICIMSVVDARFRAHAAAVNGIVLAAGALLGAVLLNGLDRRIGVAGAIVCLIGPGVLAALFIRKARPMIGKDLDRLIDGILESEDIRVIKQRGGQLPMLAAKGIDFSYGQLQVLFDVDFTVDEGEMVALLGTNGAGKSTLLKVISGIGLPSAGTVRFRGEDITYLDAERRVPLGISQVPGGRAVFGSMDVVENLQTFGYTLGRDKKRLDASIEECFEVFPRLAERRTSLAANLSGGEQQMLGLSKALILQPRLLLIDELSLGLAPIIVGQLLEMVRRINAEGTAVVLVEQSVNIALSLVDHAYFMEKGEMRFDGPAQELLAREDLLRAVFLEGASKAGA